MQKVITEPRPEVSKYAPMVINMQINPDKIRDVIGSGGKVINKIIEETGVKIDIEDDGKIFILAVERDMGKNKKAIIEGIVADPIPGTVYEKVTRLMQTTLQILPGARKARFTYLRST